MQKNTNQQETKDSLTNKKQFKNCQISEIHWI
jgi:hypothetical protein